MKILSYSERGIVNSLFYEMKFGKAHLFQEFLKLIFFPFRETEKIDFNVNLENDITIFIEQSFSDFGDADIVLLFKDNTIGNTIIFIEAKVCAENEWLLSKSYEDFVFGVNQIKKGEKAEGHSSNLFTQLYHKYHLIKFLNSNDEEVLLELSPKGLNGKRSIGKNETVREAIEIFKNHGTDNCFYVALIPEKEMNHSTDLSYIHYVEDWSDAKNKFGIITWRDVHEYVKNNIKYFTNTEAVFSHNQSLGNQKRTKNQIYYPEN
ncbi:MAG: hypothetical protein EPN82_02570 [Bacteroidetes bacterium]|nr:MAG: hypothetical protein EPN82_02570 [Bacteroidota bacterium]